MSSLLKTLVFAGTVASLALIVFPAAAQIIPVTGDCGFIKCDGEETIFKIDQVFSAYIVAATELIFTVAVGFMLYAGYMYITSSGNEEQATKAKRQILYAIIGIAVGVAARSIVFAVSPPLDQGFLDRYIFLYINAAAFLATTVAGAFVIYAGFLYISVEQSEKQENVRKAKRQLTYAIVGLIIVGLADIIVINAGQIAGGKAPTDVFLAIRNIVNGLLLFISVIAGASMIFGGYKYISSQGNQESVDEAKTTIINSIIGLIIIALSAAIINFFLSASGAL